MADNTISLYKLRNKINACLLDKFISVPLKWDELNN